MTIKKQKKTNLKVKIPNKKQLAMNNTYPNEQPVSINNKSATSKKTGVYILISIICISILTGYYFLVVRKNTNKDSSTPTPIVENNNKNNISQPKTKPVTPVPHIRPDTNKPNNISQPRTKTVKSVPHIVPGTQTPNNSPPHNTNKNKEKPKRDDEDLKEEQRKLQEEREQRIRDDDNKRIKREEVKKKKRDDEIKRTEREKIEKSKQIMRKEENIQNAHKNTLFRQKNLEENNIIIKVLELSSKQLKEKFLTANNKLNEVTTKNEYPGKITEYDASYKAIIDDKNEKMKVHQDARAIHKQKMDNMLKYFAECRTAKKNLHNLLNTDSTIIEAISDFERANYSRTSSKEELVEINKLIDDYKNQLENIESNISKTKNNTELKSLNDAKSTIERMLNTEKIKWTELEKYYNKNIVDVENTGKRLEEAKKNLNITPDVIKAKKNVEELSLKSEKVFTDIKDADEGRGKAIDFIASEQDNQIDLLNIFFIKKDELRNIPDCELVLNAREEVEDLQEQIKNNEIKLKEAREKVDELCGKVKSSKEEEEKIKHSDGK